MNSKILIVEDDQSIITGLQIVLEEENYEITAETNGAKGYLTAVSKNFDLIILDVMLPEMNGFDILIELRQKGIKTPILFLTSRKKEIDKVTGFELGCDDYMTKPFSIMELKLRIKAILRRSQNIPEINNNNKMDEINFTHFKISFNKLDAFSNDKPLNLNVKEFNLLKLLVSRKGDVVTRDEILDIVWGYDSYPVTRTVDNYILNLRKKIEPDPSNPLYILTVPTIGYKFIEN